MTLWAIPSSLDTSSWVRPHSSRPIILPRKLALEELRIEVEKYYACEIDDDAVNVSKFHFGDSITYIGNVKNLTEGKIQSICPIDLVIGGSPCNDLSLVNPERKGIYVMKLFVKAIPKDGSCIKYLCKKFPGLSEVKLKKGNFVGTDILKFMKDFSGTGHLFFDFFHVLKSVQRLNNERCVFFLFENVASMDQKTKRIISSFLMHEPALIDSKYVSPQTRPRYFWGNVPGMHM
ncbi:hypothetical protein TNCV_3609141 [Trichonephila clavipes]|nr:hypothetical protein TNCV_3609141 [Trichonephila clavipes]